MPVFYVGSYSWCVVKVSQADQVRRVSLGYQALQENLVKLVDLVSNTKHWSHSFLKMFYFVYQHKIK